MIITLTKHVILPNKQKNVQQAFQFTNKTILPLKICRDSNVIQRVYFNNKKKRNVRSES